MLKVLIVIAACEVIRCVADIYQLYMLHKEDGVRQEAYKQIKESIIDADESYDFACRHAARSLDMFGQAYAADMEGREAEEFENERRENNV